MVGGADADGARQTILGTTQTILDRTQTILDRELTLLDRKTDGGNHPFSDQEIHHFRLRKIDNSICN